MESTTLIFRLHTSEYTCTSISFLIGIPPLNVMSFTSKPASSNPSIIMRVPYAVASIRDRYISSGFVNRFIPIIKPFKLKSIKGVRTPLNQSSANKPLAPAL